MPYSAKQLHGLHSLGMLQITRYPVQFSILDKICAGLVKMKRHTGIFALFRDPADPFKIQRTGILAALPSQRNGVQLSDIRRQIHFLQHRFKNDLLAIEIQRKIQFHSLLQPFLILTGATDRQIRILPDIDQRDPFRSFGDAVKAAVTSFFDKSEHFLPPFIRFLDKEIARKAHHEKRSRRILIAAVSFPLDRHGKGRCLRDDIRIFTDTLITAVNIAVQAALALFVTSVPAVVHYFHSINRI